MPKWKVLVQGTNIPDGRKLVGCYGTRFVVALNPRSAELRAVDLVRTEILESNSIAKLQQAGAQMFLKKIEKVKHLPRMRGRGFVWYDEAEGTGQSALNLEIDTFWK